MLVSYLRHELYTSLNAVVGYSELLLEDGPSSSLPGLTTGLRTILDSCNLLLTLVGERLSSDNLRGLDTSAVAEIMDALLQASQPFIRAIVKTSAELVTIVEKLGKYGLIPDLCKIQAAGNMVQDLLKSQTSFMVQSSASASAEKVEPIQNSVTDSGRILVIDDDSMSRDLLRQKLEKNGYQIDEASGGQRGLELIAEQHYDLVLLDLRMPGLGGIEVLEQLAAQGRLPQVMVVMLSASGELDDLVRCIERGAIDYLVKPVNTTLLRTRIAIYLELSRLREQVQKLQGPSR